MAINDIQCEQQQCYNGECDIVDICRDVQQTKMIDLDNTDVQKALKTIGNILVSSTFVPSADDMHTMLRNILDKSGIPGWNSMSNENRISVIVQLAAIAQVSIVSGDGNVVNQIGSVIQNAKIDGWDSLDSARRDEIILQIAFVLQVSLAGEDNIISRITGAIRGADSTSPWAASGFNPFNTMMHSNLDTDPIFDTKESSSVDYSDGTEIGLAAQAAANIQGVAVLNGDNNTVNQKSTIVQTGKINLDDGSGVCPYIWHPWQSDTTAMSIRAKAVVEAALSVQGNIVVGDNNRVVQKSHIFEIGRIGCQSRCFNGAPHGLSKCVCNPGWIGVHCETPICSKCRYGRCVGPELCKVSGPMLFQCALIYLSFTNHISQSYHEYIYIYIYIVPRWMVR